jgi:hypothetical protein
MEKLLKYIPAILLLLANCLYIYANGSKPLWYYPKLWIYNMLLMAIIGIFVFFKFSYLMHKWFAKGEG